MERLRRPDPRHRRFPHRLPDPRRWAGGRTMNSPLGSVAVFSRWSVISLRILIPPAGVSSNPGAGSDGLVAPGGPAVNARNGEISAATIRIGTPRAAPARSCGSVHRLVMYMHCRCHTTLARDFE